MRLCNNKSMYEWLICLGYHGFLSSFQNMSLLNSALFFDAKTKSIHVCLFACKYVSTGVATKLKCYP